MHLWMVLLLAGVLAAIAVGLLVPLLMPLLQRYALARPNARSSHKVPTPQGGGLAIIVVVLAGLLLAMMLGWSGASGELRGFLLILGAATGLMALLGAIDDIHPLSAGFRLLAQTVLVGAVLAFAPAEWRVMPEWPIWLERGIGIFGGVWFVNLTNFMDGIDWMTVTEVVPVSAFLVVLAILGFLTPLGGLVAALLCGAMLGFALYNRHPARLFLGDVGSLPIGLLVAALLFMLASGNGLVAAVILPLYFVMDATETLFLRWRLGEKLSVAHRRHAYQYAVDGGMPVKTVNRHVLVLNLMLGGLAVLASLHIHWLLDGFALMLAIVLTQIIIRFFRRQKPA